MHASFSYHPPAGVVFVDKFRSGAAAEAERLGAHHQEEVQAVLRDNVVDGLLPRRQLRLRAPEPGDGEAHPQGRPRCTYDPGGDVGISKR